MIGGRGHRGGTVMLRDCRPGCDCTGGPTPGTAEEEKLLEKG